jgi:N-acetylmuramoyl-L-alanine amidase
MKFINPHHRPAGSATDRTQNPLQSVLIQGVAILLSSLMVLPLCIPAVSALSAAHHSAETDGAIDGNTVIHDVIHDTEDLLIPGAYPHRPLQYTVIRQENFLHQESEDTSLPPADSTDSLEDTFETAEPDPHQPLTQETIALRLERSLNMQARGGSRIYYPYPSGAMAVDLYKVGKQILKGQVADIGGVVYVPVQRFADLFGSFKTVYTQATEQVVITGKNLSITVKVGDPYITVNERIFYTGNKVISLGGWIFVPLTSMCKAVGATVTIRKGYYDAFITSGDPTKVAHANDYYNSTDLYWLSRIISAEAKGEPFSGQIAVGNVVLNRMRSSQFPNTVKGVIFDTKYGTQFSPVASGTIYNTPTASSIRAAKICLEGYSLSTKMIYFYNPKIATSSWIGRTRPYIMTIGNHKFYG